MKAFKLLIGTTDGPTEVQRITPEDPEVRSVVCLDGKAMALPISDDYDAFVRRPTGVVEALTGHGAYRVDVSDPIGCGYSWQLGLLAAHILSARGGLAGTGDAAKEAVWLTGEVDHHLNIGAVGDVELKLMRATSTLKGLMAEGIRVTVVVPETCGPEARQAIDRAFPAPQTQPRLIAVRHLDDVLPAFGLRGRKRLFGRAKLALPKSFRPRRAALGVGMLAAMALLTVAAWPVANQTPAVSKGQSTKAAPLAADPEGAPPRIALIESRAPGGQHCAAVDFNRARPVIARHLFADPGEGNALGTLPRIRPQGLCDLRHRVVNPGLGSLAVAAIAARYEESGRAFRTRRLLAQGTLKAGATLDLDARPPRALASPLIQRLVVLALPETWPQAALRLQQAAKALSEAPSAESWTAAVARLAGEGLFMTTAGEIFPLQSGP